MLAPVKAVLALPDAAGRRDILRIHTRAMRANGALAESAACYIDAEDGACPLDMDEASAMGPSLAEATERITALESEVATR